MLLTDIHRQPYCNFAGLVVSQPGQTDTIVVHSLALVMVELAGLARLQGDSFYKWYAWYADIMYVRYPFCKYCATRLGLNHGT